MADTSVLLHVENLKKYFSVKKKMSAGRKKTLKAVDGVTLDVSEGEVVGLVGESGCGKSTLGRTILKLHTVTDGEIVFRGEHIEKYGFQQMRPLRKDMRMIFQDPYASLNPRSTVAAILQAPLNVFRIGTEKERKELAADMLLQVGLSESFLEKYPHEMSGGQRQRVVIARAMITNPSLVVCDEPVSALDVSVRAQVLNLMKDMQQKYNTAYLFISHDLSTVRYICDRIAVMYLGHIVECAPADELFENARHPYTRALLSAIPIPDVEDRRHRIILEGDVPSPIDPPSGCPFRTRCPYATQPCGETVPPLEALEAAGHYVACINRDMIPLNIK